MLTSELIEMLQQLIKERGDLPVAMQRGEFSETGTKVCHPELEVAYVAYGTGYIQDRERNSLDIPEIGGLEYYLTICWDRESW